MYKTTSNLASTLAAAALASLVALAPDAFAQSKAVSIPGRIITKDGKAVPGNIRWQPVGKKYIITQSRGGAMIETELTPDKVAKVDVPKPQQLDAAINAVKSGKAAAAVPVLEKIVQVYAMLNWDEPAARYLAEAKLASGDANGAIAVCEDLIKVKPEIAYLGNVAPTYWQALLKVNKTAKLQELISKAISTGDSYASAAALILRGDILMEKKESMNALKDGYLRVVVLYKGVRDLQPEALFKAAKAFDAVNKTQQAERMRGMLRSQYPQSEYARKI